MAPLAILVLGAVSLLRGATATLPTMAMPATSFKVEACNKASSGLSSQQTAGLTSRGFTKCVFGAFDVLVAGTSTYPDSYLLTAANTIAGILDQDTDGLADDHAVAKALSFKRTASPPVMQGGVTQAEEGKGDSLDQAGFKYAFSLQTWKGDSAATNLKIITEEVFHMVTAEGYGAAYPNEFGMGSWKSVACKEMGAAECVTWHHAENTCPNPGTHTEPPLQGTCNTPDCDCNEWFHQVALVLAGMEPGWRSTLLPKTKTTLEASLSKAFKDMMANPKYHQLQKPLTYVYSTKVKQAPAGRPAGEAMTKCDALTVCASMKDSSTTGNFCAGRAGAITACSSEASDCATRCQRADRGTGTSNAKANAPSASTFKWGCVTTQELKAGCTITNHAHACGGSVALTLVVVAVSMVILEGTGV